MWSVPRVSPLHVTSSGGPVVSRTFLSCAPALTVAASAQSSTQVLFDLGRHDGVNGDPVTNPAAPSGGSGSFYRKAIGGPGQGQTSGDTYTGLVASDNNALAGWSLTLGAGNQANGTAN